VLGKILASEAAELLGVTVQAIHKQLKSKNLPYSLSQKRTYFGHEASKEVFGLSFKKKTVCFQIVKGGTGKTTIAHAIALCANTLGARVLCIDLDAQGNLTEAFCVDSTNLPVMMDIINNNVSSVNECIVNVAEGLDLIPSNIENVMLDSKLMLSRAPLDGVYKDIIMPLKDNYDFIIIDCPPMLGHSVTAAALASDLIVSPLNPDKFSEAGYRIIEDELVKINKAHKTNIKLKFFINKFDGRTILSNQTVQALLQDEKVKEKAFNAAIRQDQQLPNSIAQGSSVFQWIQPTNAREDIFDLTKEMLDIEILPRKTTVKHTEKETI
jgi:chromosome partitioning protein